MIHSATLPATRLKSASDIINQLIDLPHKTPNVRNLSQFNSIPIAATVAYRVLGTITVPHRLLRVHHVESKNLTGNDVMNVLVSTDTRIDSGVGFRDSFLFGTLDTATWIQFVNATQTLDIRNWQTRIPTVYKAAYLNQSAAAAICGIIVQVEL